MSNSNKYDSYFDDEEVANAASQHKKESPEKIKIDQKSPGDYKMPKSRPMRNSGEFNQPDHLAVHRKIVKDVHDLEQMDLEELNAFPYSGKYAQPVENYESLDHLYQTYGDENMEYEVVGVGDLQNYLAENENQMILESSSLEEQIALLEKNFEEDQENYEVLYKLIYMYRLCKKKDKLKEMREHTLKLYPLGDDMWKEWIDDELAEIPKEDFDRKYQFINLFFQRALSDFYYFKICKKLMKFILALKREAERRNLDLQNYPDLKIENIRKKFEEYLEFWGLDFNQSSGLWDLYLNFEKSNLNKFTNISDESNLNQSLNIMRSIYRRRLSFPHIDLDIVWNEYKKWESNEDEVMKVEIKYNESSKKAEEMINLEENFNELLDYTKSEDDPSKLLEFLKTEVAEKFKKHFNYIRLYFEKALEINQNDEEIWSLYIEYTKTLNKNSELTYSVLLRSCKCCFFNVKFWVLLFRQMELLGHSFEVIQAKIQEAYSSAEDENFVSEIWKYTLEFHCRFFDASFEQLTHIRALFDASINDLQTKGNKDYILRVLMIWAEFENYKVKDHTKVNDIMNRIVKLSPTSDNWKTYINYEKYFGDVESIRKVYKRALEYCKEDKDYFSESWIVWEKIFGTVKSIEYALIYSKTKKGKERKPLKLSLRGKRENPEEVPEEIPEDTSKTLKKRKLVKLRKKSEEEQMQVEKEIEGNKAEAHDRTNKTVIIKNLSPMLNEEELLNFIKSEGPDLEIADIRIVRDRKGNSKGFSFVDFLTIESAHDCAVLLKNKVLDDNVITCAVSKPPKSGENDKRTIFVNNISYDSTEEKIKSVFEPYGQIYDVRIIYDHVTKKPKGFCYVEFANEKSVESVLQNRTGFYIDGRKVIVKSSQSVARMRENVKFVAHVTNIPFTLTENKLTEFFTKNGVENIVDCLIPTDEEGKSKGIGFVEFSNEESLKKGLLMTGKIIRGRPINIKLSTRNITRNKKRKASNDLEEEIDVNKKRKTSESENIPEQEKAKEKGLGNKDFRQFLK